DDDSGPGLFSRIDRRGTEVLGPGTYWVRANEYGSNNALPAYTLSVTAMSVPGGDAYEPDDAAMQASAIAMDGTPQAHSLHVGTDVDWARFTLTAPSEVTIETNGAAGDTELRLFGPYRPTPHPAYDDDSGPGLFSR